MGRSKKRKPQQESSDSRKRQKLEIEQLEEDVQTFAPREVNILQYVESHAEEIQHCTQKLQVEPCGQQVSQKLPRHMRRRAMGHDAKRLPRSVRNMFMNTAATKKNKRPSRKHRRRPKNLLAEYTRRQRKHVWLETHIWHAKRFHMIEKWGCKLPWKPTMKSERACYRAAARYCMIQDMSYLCCIELLGEQHILLDGLSHLTSKHTGQTFAAVPYLSGTREGHTVLYHYDNYPSNPIGPVDFMWNPSQPITKGVEIKSANQSAEHDPVSQKQVWIWCHPACFEEVWREISQCFNLTEQKVSKPLTTSECIANEKIDNNETSGKLNNTKKSKLDDSTFAVEDNFYSGVTLFSKETDVQMTSLSGSLVRLRLTGPESNAVLVDTLQQSVVSPKDDGTTTWWSKFYKENSMTTAYEKQCSYIEMVGQCMSPAELSPHCIVAMTTRDPRITRPLKRAKVALNETKVSSVTSECRDKPAAEISSSPLWRSDIQDHVTTSKMSDHHIHLLKSDCLIPSMDLEQTDEESRVPVIIIQRPGTSYPTHPSTSHTRLGWGSGFDVLLPKGWAMPFWLALVYRGARCGGLKELEGVASEGKLLLFPNTFPDTQAGRTFEITQEKEQVDKYNRMPPAKRPNYTKLNVSSPFRCPWEALVSNRPTTTGRKTITQAENLNTSSMETEVKANEVNSTKDGVSSAETDAVVNSDSKLQTVANGTGVTKTSKNDSQTESNKIPFTVVRSAKILRKLQHCCEPKKKGNSNQKHKAGLDSDDSIIDDIGLDQALVPIKLEMVHKGSPTKFAHVCIPSEDDMTKLDSDKNYGGPFEPLQQDPALIERKMVKRELKKKGIEKKVKVDRKLKPLSELGEMRSDSCCRKVVGYLSSGGYSLGAGNGTGMGFVSVEGFRELLKRARSKLGVIVLVRNTTSQQYRFARLAIIE